MNKRKKTKDPLLIGFKNPVAKYAHQFNKAQVFKDKSKYQRHSKHKGKEPFPMMFSGIIGKGFKLFLLTRTTNALIRIRQGIQSFFFNRLATLQTNTVGAAVNS